MKLTLGEQQSQLLDALEDFKKRIVPMFETQQSLRDEITALQLTVSQEEDNRRGLEDRVRELGQLPAKVTELKRENVFATKLADEATLVADKMKNEMIALKEENDSCKRLLAESEAEKNRYRDQSVRNNELVRLVIIDHTCQYSNQR